MCPHQKAQLIRGPRGPAGLETHKFQKGQFAVQHPLDGLARAGWRLAFAEKSSDAATPEEGDQASDNYAYSLGIAVARDGKLTQVHWGSPAFKAGLSVAVQLIAVNGRSYKGERMSQAITANKEGKAPLALLVKEGDEYRTVTIDYRDGLRYPRLERIEGSVERLEAGLLAPRKP
jgi:predicted metalloprotease with PDZ domain